MEDISLIIVEDEAIARGLLVSLVSRLPGFRVLDACDGVDSGYALITEKMPDAILLDIQMPQKDGFVLVEMLKELEKPPEIIFITAYENFAIKAVKSAAFDYLLKPVKKDELYASLCRLREKLRQEQQKDRMEQLLENLRNKNKIRFNDRKGFRLVDPKDIIFIKADGNYCKLILSSEQELLVCMNIGKIEQQVNHLSFVKISRSCLINLDYLIRVDRKSLVCELKNQQVHYCSISKSFLKELEKKIQ